MRPGERLEAESAAGRSDDSARAIEARGLATFLGDDLIDIATGATLLLLVLNTNEDPPLFLLSIVACAVGLFVPAVRRNPASWLAMGVFIAARLAFDWEAVDNHIITTSYWTLAVGFALASRTPGDALRSIARMLLVLVFGLAVFWKLFSGEFADGRFFRFTLLTDDRFEVVAEAIGGTSADVRHDNLVALAEVEHRHPPRTEAVLTEGPRNRVIAGAMTAWGIFVEGAIALAFALPSRRRVEWARHAGLFAFAATTYAVVPVGGFGCLLMVLGICQTEPGRLRDAYRVGFLVLVVWSALWPALFLD